MKNKFFSASVFLIMLSQFLTAQENGFEKALKKYNNDTIEYIQKEILDIRDSYVGWALDSLLKNLPVIISYGNEDGPRRVPISPATVLFFSSSRTVMEKLAEKKFPMSLVIRWMTPLDINELRCLGLKDGGDWTQSVYNHYKNKIIGKIESIDYNPSFSDSRFDMDCNGFHGINKPDTTYYSDGKIASIGHYAVDKNLIMSGKKFGLWTKYYHNGQIESQGNYDMYSLLCYQSPEKGRRIESSYKVGKWVYYYENGQIKAIGTYQTTIIKANTGIDNQFYKSSLTTANWKFFNPDGSKSNDKDKIIADIEHNPNCD